MTVNDKYLIDGTATEIFAAYADEASENPSFNEGAATISSVFDQSFDDTLETYGTPFYSEVTDANVFITTYDFATETALENAIEQFSSELIAEKNGGTEEIFNVEEVIYGKYYHAVSYSERIIVDIRAFSYQSVRGVNVYRAVLAVSEAAITPVQGDVEIWLEIKLPNGSPRTIRINSLDDYDADFGSQYVFEATDDALTKAANKQKQLYYQNNARNYLAYDTNPDDNVVENSLVDGQLALSMLPLGYTYTVKVRSTVYENVDFTTTATLTETSSFADIGTLYLTARQEPDWIASRAENSANSLLQGIRIRLGADIYDASSSDDQDYDDAGYTQDGIPLTNYSYMTSVGEGVLNAAIGQATGQAVSAIVNAITNAIGGIGGQIVGALANAGLGQLTGLIGSYDSNSQYVDANGKPIFVPWTNYVTGFEKGIEDNSDSVVYIEAWVSSSTINSLFAMIYNLLLDYCGYGQVSVDRRYSAADLCAVPEGTDTSDVQIVNFTGVFDENSDDRIYDYTFASEGEYINANYSTGARLVGSIIGFALPWVLDSFVDVGFINDNSFTLLNLLQMFAYQLDFLMDIFDQATRLLSHLLPESAGIIRHGLIKFAGTDDRGYRFNYYETAPAEYRNIAGELLEYVAEQDASADNVPDIPSIFSRDSGLDLSGTSLAAVRALTERQVVISRMVVTSDFRILLPDYDIEIVMAPLAKSVYILYLLHPENIMLGKLRGYRDELHGIYRAVTGRSDHNIMMQIMADLTGPFTDSIYMQFAWIKEAFHSKFRSGLAMHYRINSLPDGCHGIGLDRTKLEFEDRDFPRTLLSRRSAASGMSGQ